MAKIVPPNRKRNCLWPLQRSAKGWRTGAIAERYTAALHHLVRTKLGSIIWAPTFGTRIEHYRTQILTDESATLLGAEIKQAIARWIPDIVMTGFSLEASPDDQTLTVKISWGIPDSGPAMFRGNTMPSFSFGPINQTITV